MGRDDDFLERLDRVVALAGGQSELARRTGITQSTIAGWKAGSDPSRRKLVAIADAVGVSVAWLVSGEEPIRKGASHSVAPLGDSYPPAHLLPEGMVPIAMLDARAGFGAGQLVENLPRKAGFVAFSEDWIRRRLRVDPRDLLLVEGQGDSMVPTIVDGAVMLVWTVLDRVKDGAIYAVVLEGELMVKRLQRLPGGRVKVKTDNPAYDDYELDAEAAANLQVIGQVIWKGASA